MDIEIIESEVVFGKFPSKQIFLLEKSKFYSNGKDRLKTVEFVYIDELGENILLLEAKKSAPNINNEESIGNVNEYLKEIERKFHHSLAATFGLVLGRQTDRFSEVPASIQNMDLKTVNITLMLVITREDFKPSWIADWQNMLNTELKGLIRAWNNVEISVIDFETAKHMNLVISRI